MGYSNVWNIKIKKLKNMGQLNILYFKFKYYIYQLIGLFITFLIPVKPLMLLIGASIFIDTLSGIYRAYHQKIKVSSRALSEIVKKMIIYQTAIILLFAIDYFILNDFLKLFITLDYSATKFGAFILIGIEVLSVIENLKLAGFDLIKKSKDVLNRSNQVKSEVTELFTTEKEKPE